MTIINGVNIFLKEMFLFFGKGDFIQFLNFRQARFCFFGIKCINVFNVMMHEHPICFDLFVLIPVDKIISFPLVGKGSFSGGFVEIGRGFFVLHCIKIIIDDGS